MRGDLASHAGAMLGPDLAELASGSILAARSQDRRSAGVNAPVRAVPSGLSEIEHFRQAFDASSPFDSPPPYH